MLFDEFSFTFAANSHKLDISLRRKAAHNLQKLIGELPSKERELGLALLDKFVFSRSRAAGELVNDKAQPYIVLSIGDFVNFTYYARKSPKPAQLWSLETLREELLHLLDKRLFKVSDKPQWQQSVYAELGSLRPEAAHLLKYYRERTSTRYYIKPDILEYPKEDQPAELLVELLLVKGFLVKQGMEEENARQKMAFAFPLTYGEAEEFAQRIDSFSPDQLERAVTEEKPAGTVLSEVEWARQVKAGKGVFRMKVENQR